MLTAIPDFKLARVLLAGDGEARRFDDALNGIVGLAERPTRKGRADHGALAQC